MRINTQRFVHSKICIALTASHIVRKVCKVSYEMFSASAMSWSRSSWFPLKNRTETRAYR